jgi:hypothetical protein
VFLLLNHEFENGRNNSPRVVARARFEINGGYSEKPREAFCDISIFAILQDNRIGHDAEAYNNHNPVHLWRDGVV